MLTAALLRDQLKDNPPWHVCTQWGQELYAQATDIDWAVADLCVYLCQGADLRAGGRLGVLAKFAAEVGSDKTADTLAKYVRTAEVFPPDSIPDTDPLVLLHRPEAENLFFRHFWVVANYTDHTNRGYTPDDWIQAAIAHGWSAADLQQQLGGPLTSENDNNEADRPALPPPVIVGEGTITWDEEGQPWLNTQRVDSLLADLRLPDGTQGRLLWQSLPEDWAVPGAPAPATITIPARTPKHRA